jgi:hypothetical protein
MDEIGERMRTLALAHLIVFGTPALLLSLAYLLYYALR